MTLERLLSLDQAELAAIPEAVWKAALAPHLAQTRPSAVVKSSPAAKVTPALSSKRKVPDVNTKAKIMMRRLELKMAGTPEEQAITKIRTEFIQYDLTGIV